MLKSKNHNIINTACFIIAGFINFVPELKFIKYICIVYLLLFIVSKGVFSDKRFRVLNSIVFAFSLIVLLSGYISDKRFGDFDWHVNITSSILFVFQTIVLLGYAEFLLRFNQYKSFIKQFLVLWGGCLLLSDVYILANLSRIQDDTASIYLIGNKFIISYGHILFCALFFSLKESHFLIKSILIIFCIFISKKVYCTTGIIGALSFFFLVIYRSIIGKYLYKRTVFYTCIILSVCFALFISVIQETAWFESFMDMLGETKTMSGRTGIYLLLAEIIEKSPYWGYGNGNSQTYVEYYTNIGNAQNGLLADVVDWGMIGTCFFLMIPYAILGKTKYSHQSYPIICFLYMYIVVAMVEVTMNIKFIAGISLLMLFSDIGISKGGKLESNHKMK